MCGAELQSLPEGVQRVAAALQVAGHAHSPVLLDGDDVRACPQQRPRERPEPRAELDDALAASVGRFFACTLLLAFLAFSSFACWQRDGH